MLSCAGRNEVKDVPELWAWPASSSVGIAKILCDTHHREEGHLSCDQVGLRYRWRISQLHTRARRYRYRYRYRYRRRRRRRRRQTDKRAHSHSCGVKLSSFQVITRGLTCAIPHPSRFHCIRDIPHDIVQLRGHRTLHLECVVQHI